VALQRRRRCSDATQPTLRCSDANQPTLRCSDATQPTLRCSDANQPTLRCSDANQPTLRCSDANHAQSSSPLRLALPPDAALVAYGIIACRICAHCASHAAWCVRRTSADAWTSALASLWTAAKKTSDESMRATLQQFMLQPTASGATRAAPRGIAS
jgi:hypothetical protein